MAQVVEHLPSMCEALSSNPQSTKITVRMYYFLKKLFFWTNYRIILFAKIVVNVPLTQFPPIAAIYVTIVLY
jgi:hypothetical protein